MRLKSLPCLNIYFYLELFETETMVIFEANREIPRILVVENDH